MTLICLLVPGTLRAQPEFSVFPGPDPDTAFLQIDPSRLGRDHAPRLEAQIGATQPAALGRPYRRIRGLYLLRDVRVGLPVRLRALHLSEDRWQATAWSSPVAIPPAPANQQRPGRIGAADWDIRSHPTEAYGLQLRLERLPAPGDGQIMGFRMRRSAYDLNVLVPAEAGVWHTVHFPPELGRLIPNRPDMISIAAMTPKGVGPWSPKREARVIWQGEPRPPDPPRPGDWMVRPNGMAGTITIETVAQSDPRASHVTGLEARWVAADGQFTPQGDWSSWHSLGDMGDDGAGEAMLGGLSAPAGQRVLVQIRWQSDRGPGQASVPKMVTPQDFGLPAEALLGDLNPARSGRIRIPKGSVIAAVSEGEADFWDIVEGPEAWDYLHPTRAAHKLPAEVTLAFSNGHRLTVRRRPDLFVAETVRDLGAFLALPAAEKSGTTLLIGPEWIETTVLREQFRGAFGGLSAPVTVRPREPELGTLISQWLISSAGPGRSSGNVTLEDLRFYLPEAVVLRNGGGVTSIIDAGRSPGPVSHIRIHRVHVFSDAMPGRLGYVTDLLVRGIDLTGARHTEVRDSEISHVTYGLAVGGQHALVRGNHIHHMTADPFNIHFRRGTETAPTVLRDIVIEHNTAHDFMGDAWRLHGDALHMWMIGAGSAARTAWLEGLRYRGNVTFPGFEGIRAPARLSPSFRPLFLNTGLSVTPAHHRRILRVNTAEGAADIRLPRAGLAVDPERGPPRGMTVVVQKTDPGPHAVRIHQADDAENAPSWTLRGPWETLILTARIDPETGLGQWQVKRPTPAYQGFFADDNDIPLTDVEIEGNIFWGMAPWQIALRNRPQQGVRVHHNTILLPYPGDLNQDGRYNTPADGVTLSNGRINIGAWDDSVSIWANIAGSIHVARDTAEGKAPAIWGNQTLEWSNMGQIQKLFAAAQRAVPGDPDSLVLFPTSRDAAIAMARPRAGGMLSTEQIGALGAVAAEDWWNFDAGQRQDAAVRETHVVGLSPAHQDSRVAPARKSLTVELSQPVGLGRGVARLVGAENGEVIAQWSLADPAATRRFGAKLEFPLTRDLPAGQTLEMQLPADGLRDVFGQKVRLPTTPWRFIVDPESGVNLLYSADPSHPWWQSAGWRSQVSATGLALYSRVSDPRGSVLRLDSRRFPALRDPVQRSLRFDYTLPNTSLNLRTRLRFFDKDGKADGTVTVAWGMLAAGKRNPVAPGVVATRSPVGGDYGLPETSVWRAEVTWTPPQDTSRVLIDLLEGFPSDGKARVGRLMLSDGQGGEGWSAP